LSEDAKKILVVEDESNLRELVRGRLEDNGYEVAVAADGYKALAVAREFHPDLVVLDLMLPKMDGYTVCRMLRSAAEGSEVPIILFSARSAQDDRLRGEEVGANAYVNKPFDAPVLLGKIRELLDPEGAGSETAPAARPAPEGAAPNVADAGDRTGTEAESAAAPAVPPATVEELPPAAEPARTPVDEPAAEPVSDTPLSREERLARARPPAGADTGPGTAPAATPADEPAPAPAPSRGAGEVKPRGFLARFFGRIFGSRKG